MERRTYLGSLGVAGLTGAAGCLDDILSVASNSDGTVLGPPEQTRGDPIHPTHGDALPSFEVYDPFADRLVTDEQFHENRTILMTFYLTNCPSNLCPALLQRLRVVQDDAVERGYEDDVTLIAITFDPERDTPDVIAEQATNVGLDPESDNLHLLRPESNEDAKELVEERFGQPFIAGDHDHDHDNGHEDEDLDGENHEHEDNNHEDEADPSTDESESNEHEAFTHYYLMLLANDQGVVERSYPNAVQTELEQLIDDVRAVIDG